MNDLPVLLIVVPILGSVVVLLTGLLRAQSGWYIAALVSIIHAGMAVVLARHVFQEGRVRYAVGGFEIPYGIELLVDGLSITMVVLIAVVAIGVLSYSYTAGPRSNPFYVMFLLLIAGLCGVSLTGDVFNMYVFLEITGLAAYSLVASGEGGRSAVAALKYLIIGTVGASLFLLGVGYAYIATGTLNMLDLSVELAHVGYGSTLVQSAFVFIVIGLFIKIAVFPLHTWQPEAYAGAPDSVSGLISALVSTVSAYAVARIAYSVFTIEFFIANPLVRELLIGGAAVSVIAGSVLAVSQTEIKRMLAYSSVAQFGLIVGAIAIANQTALVGAIVHLFGHAIMKGGLFLAAGVIATETGARTIEEYRGIGTRFPTGAGVFGILGFSLVGVPPAIGFVGKWYIALGAFEAEAWSLAIVIVGSTLLTLAYFARLVERMYFHHGVSTNETMDGFVATDGGHRVSRGMYAAVICATITVVALSGFVFQYEQLLEPTINSLLS